MFKMKKNIQIDSLDEVIKCIQMGRVVYCKIHKKYHRNKNDWDCRYGLVLLPTGEYKILKDNWYSGGEWDAYSADIRMEEILKGNWFMKEEKKWVPTMNLNGSIL